MRHLLTTLVIATSLMACQTSPAPPATTAPTEPSELSPTPDDGVIRLTLPAFEAGEEDYYAELLETALTNAGYETEITITDVVPQERAIQMLENDTISMLWLVRSAERDETYPTVDVDLTNGLIGQRILLVRPEDTDLYASVETLDDFRALDQQGAFGQNWFDLTVWQHNDLDAIGIDGEWRNIYGMLAAGDRGVDYFSRGFTEIVADAQAHPELAIEENLVLIYERDFRFYLSDAGLPHLDIITEALNQAVEEGIVDNLIRDYWAEDFETLNYDDRVQLRLETPE